MDRYFQMNAYTLFIERYGSIITKYRKENDKNVEFLRKMAAEKEKIKVLVPADVWQKVDIFIDLVDTHSNIKGKHLYAQGVKDGMSLAHFLDTDFTDMDFDEIVFDTDLNERL